MTAVPDLTSARCEAIDATNENSRRAIFPAGDGRPRSIAVDYRGLPISKMSGIGAVGKSFDRLSAYRSRPVRYQWRNCQWQDRRRRGRGRCDRKYPGARHRYTNLATSGFVNIATNSADAGGRAPVSDLRFALAYKFGAGSTVGQQ